MTWSLNDLRERRKCIPKFHTPPSLPVPGLPLTHLLKEKKGITENMSSSIKVHAKPDRETVWNHTW
jgi:hypothetical protein